MAKKMFQSRRRGPAPEEQERWLLEQELSQTQCRLQRAFDAFNLVSDPDLIEAWVFEINAQQARYSYLLKRRKMLESGEPSGDEVKT